MKPLYAILTALFLGSVITLCTAQEPTPNQDITEFGNGPLQRLIERLNEAEVERQEKMETRIVDIIREFKRDDDALAEKIADEMELRHTPLFQGLIDRIDARNKKMEGWIDEWRKGNRPILEGLQALSMENRRTREEMKGFISDFKPLQSLVKRMTGLGAWIIVFAMVIIGGVVLLCFAIVASIKKLWEFAFGKESKTEVTEIIEDQLVQQIVDKTVEALGK